MKIQGQYLGGSFGSFEIQLTDNVNACIDFRGLPGMPIYVEDDEGLEDFCPDEQFYKNDEELIEIGVFVTDIEITDEGTCLIICRPNQASLAQVQLYVRSAFQEYELH